MNECLTKFELGPYVGLVAVAENENSFIDELVNLVIEGSSFKFDQELLDTESVRIEADLRQGLKDDGKPVGAFCYLRGIKEHELKDYCRELFVRTTAENTIIKAIAQTEHIKVTSQDIETYKKIYRDQYIKALLSEPDLTDGDLESAILTKKVLRFLMENNTWNRGEE